MPRRLHVWKLRSRELALGDRTLIMGVLNVTPDSFSDGGRFLDPDRAYARAMEMEEQGADIIDIGAESTKPGAHPIPAAEELRRLIPVLKRLRDKLSIPVSVDTYKAETAERALELGVEIINDPSGFTFDPQLAKPLIQYDAGVIFNHMRGRPETWASLGPMPDVMGSVVKDLDASVNRARRAGVDRSRIVIDPGIGFGKRREQNSEIIARLSEMNRLELPILIGPSRKAFLAQSREEATRFATAAAVASSILNGAHIVRVHDVPEMKVAAAIADEIVKVAQRRAEDAREQTQTAGTRRSRPTPPAPPKHFSQPRSPVRPPLVERAASAASASGGDVEMERPPVREERPPIREERPPVREERPPQREGRPPQREGRPPQRQERPPRREGRPPQREDRPARQDDRRPFANRSGQRPPPRPVRPKPDRGEVRPPRSFDRSRGPDQSRPRREDRTGGSPRPFDPSRPPNKNRPFDKSRGRDAGRGESNRRDFGARGKRGFPPKPKGNPSRRPPRPRGFPPKPDSER